MTHKNILLSSALVAGILSLTACSGSGDPAAKEKAEVPVTVVTAKPSAILTSGVTASGQIEAANTASISTRLMGAITKIYVKVGDKVSRGQLLVTISSDDINAKKAQADAQIAGSQADLDNARKDYDRYSALYSKQSATASELDNATLRLQGAKSRLEAARQMRREIDASAAYAQLTAPFAGVVTQKLLDEGSLAAPGAPILVVEQNSQLQVNATLAESDITKVATGDKAQIEVRSTGLNTTGTVTQMSVSSVATGGQYQVKISLPQDMQKSVYAGMYVNVFIPQKTPAHPATQSPEESASVFIPVAALVEKDQLTGIYTVSPMHTASLRWIRTGKKWNDKVEVLSGLNSDEPFIVSASGKLYNGAPVIEK